MGETTTARHVPADCQHTPELEDLHPVAPDIGAAMAELARTLQREHASEHDTLQAVTTAAVAAVPGAAQAVISLVTGRKKIIQAQAGTDPGAQHLDELQAELDDGPCLTAI